MPRERIHGEHNPYAPEDPRRTVIEVSWLREQMHVQLGTIMIDGPTGDTVPVRDSQGDPLIGGVYLSLDRPGLNRLIRNLRRARDQAFGRDE